MFNHVKYYDRWYHIIVKKMPEYVIPNYKWVLFYYYRPKLRVVSTLTEGCKRRLHNNGAEIFNQPFCNWQFSEYLHYATLSKEQKLVDTLQSVLICYVMWMARSFVVVTDCCGDAFDLQQRHIFGLRLWMFVLSKSRSRGSMDDCCVFHVKTAELFLLILVSWYPKLTYRLLLTPEFSRENL